MVRADVDERSRFKRSRRIQDNQLAGRETCWHFDSRAEIATQRDLVQHGAAILPHGGDPRAFGAEQSVLAATRTPRASVDSLK